MRILILCAGQGTRLRPLTDDRPKCMVPLLGKPMLEHQLETIRRCGITDVSLVTGYAADSLASYGTRSFHNAEYARTNMVVSMFCAADLFDDKDDLIVSYSDIVYEPRVLQALIANRSDIATVVDDNWRALWETRSDDPLSDAETLKLKADGTLAEIGKKTTDINDIQGQYIGATKFSRAVQSEILHVYEDVRQQFTAAGRVADNMYMTDFLQSLIDADQALGAAHIQSGWLEVDTLDDLANYEKLAASGDLSKFWSPAAGGSGQAASGHN